MFSFFVQYFKKRVINLSIKHFITVLNSNVKTKTKIYILRYVLKNFKDQVNWKIQIEIFVSIDTPYVCMP